MIDYYTQYVMVAEIAQKQSPNTHTTHIDSTH